MSDLCSQFINFKDHKQFLAFSQVITLAIGVLAVLLALSMENVLSLMLYSYAFLVSGLLVPVIGGLFWKKANATAAFWAMLLGGSTTVLVTLLVPEKRMPLGLDANIYGILLSFIVFVLLSNILAGKAVKTLKHG